MEDTTATGSSLKVLKKSAFTAWILSSEATWPCPLTAGAVALGPADGLDGEQWAENEFGQAPLGDRRLSRRLVSIAAVKALDPAEPFTECANGKTAQMQGYHRFIEHPDRDAVSMETTLEPHRQRTIKRMRNEARVLCPQDSTILDYSSLHGCKGLGPTGTWPVVALPVAQPAREMPGARTKQPSPHRPRLTTHARLRTVATRPERAGRLENASPTVSQRAGMRIANRTIVITKPTP